MTTSKLCNLSADPRWIMSVHDLPCEIAPAVYRITPPDGVPIVTVLKDRKRQMIDALSIGPVFCASTVRLGDAIFRLKRDHGIKPKTKSNIVGREFYVLDAKIERIGGAI